MTRRRIVVDENKAARLARPDLRHDPVAITIVLIFLFAGIAWCIYGLRGHRVVHAPVCDCLCAPAIR